MVETLMVPARSPPVPQVSTSLARTSSGTGTVSATSSMAPNMPVSSSDVSPLHRSPKMNAAICDGLAAPSRISRSAAADSAELRCSPAARRPRTTDQPPRSAKATGAAPSPGRADGWWGTASGTPQSY